MKAARFDRTGDLSALHVTDLDAVQPGPEEVVVQVAASAVNPSDVKNVQGMMHHTTLPRTPGRDFAGTIIRGPAELIGQEVWGSGGDLGFTRDGAHAEEILLPRNAVAPKPSALSLEEAATVGVPFITAWSALVTAGAMTESDILAVTGAAGSVGQAALQIARWRGARAIGIVRDPTQEAAVTATGAGCIVNDSPDDMAQAVKDATGGQGATLMLDVVGGSLFAPSLASLALGGRLAVIATSQPRLEIALLDFYRRALTLHGVNTLLLDAAASARVLTDLAPGFEQGALRPPPIAARYALEDIAEAYEAALNSPGGKILITP